MSISQPRATINCDIGEGYYRWSLGPDDELLKLVDYANIACGFHAGDHGTMLRTVRSALKYGVKIGAHPGLDDIKGFGRRRMEVTPEEVYSGALYQLGALKAIVEAEGGKMSHVKPHGMLWFILRDNVEIMRAFMKAQVALFGTSIPMLGCENSAHDQVCKEAGVPFIPEIFADIDYNAEGRNLGVPESKAPTPELITKKLERVFTKQETYDVDGNPVALSCTHNVFSLCLHSDMPTALANVQAARAVFNRYTKVLN